MAKYENELRKILTYKGYTVIRSAGSMGEGDLVAINKFSKAVVIECKAVKGDRFYVSDTQKNKEQFQHMKSLKCKWLYAVRFKGLKQLIGSTKSEKWRFFNTWMLDDKYPVMRICDGLTVEEVFT